MTNGGTEAMVATLRRLVSSVNGLVALGAIATLIIGFFLGSPVGRIVCGVLFVGAGVYLITMWRNGKLMEWGSGRETEEDVYSQSPEGNMKKLLFDDFQPHSSAKYVVREVEEEEHVVPSTKSVQPVTIAAKEDKAAEFDVSDFFDLDSDIFRTETEPRSEFHFLLSKVLVALKEVVFGHSVAFFWANREKNQMVLEAKATESQNFMKNKRFEIGDDIVSQVALTGKPRMLGRINPISEKELLSYYDDTDYVKSCVVVPVYYVRGEQEQAPVGVIVADSKAEDAFGPETYGLLGKFTKLVSALIKSYTEKYDLLLDSELLSSIRRMQDRVRGDATEVAVLSSLADEAGRLVNWDFLTIVMYAEEKNGWVVQKVVNRVGQPYVQENQIIAFNESIVGQVIMANNVETIGNLAAEPRKRFFPGEENERQGSFLCVPISSLNRCYGALSLQSRNTNNFAGNEAEVIYRLVESAGALLEVLYMNDLVKDYVVVDHLTGSYTRKHFLKKLEEEVQRADDLGADLAMVTVAVDNKQELIDRYAREGFDSILSQTARIVRANIRSYDIVGRQDADRIGVLLVNTSASDAYLWAEKIRKAIASHITTLGGRSFSFTVSAGVCGLTDGMHKDELLAGTSQVLHKAIENGGNLVRVF